VISVVSYAVRSPIELNIFNKRRRLKMSKLALNGGTPVRSAADKPLEEPWPETRPEDFEAVKRVFDSGEFLGIHHPEIEALEKELSEYFGVEYCLAMANGTSSLHAAVAAAGCQPGDEVIVPALTFLASASAVLHHVCIPVFADIDPNTFNIDPKSVESKITNRTRAIMAVDLHGLPADYDELRKIADKHNLVIIEDAAHAMGAVYKGRKAGNLADVAGTSLMPVKQLATCGEGGIFFTNRADFYNRASMVRSFGEVIQKGKARAYNAFTLGWNYRINPVQAAYLRSQLKRLDHYTELFSTNGNYLSDGLRELPGIIPPYIPEGSTHVYHMHRIKFDPVKAGLDVHPGRFAKAVEEAMAAEGLTLRLYQNAPIPGQAMFRLKEGFGNGIPWSLTGANDINYDVEDYPVTLEVLETTRCIGKNGSAGTWYFRNRDTMDLYLEGFRKLWDNLDELAAYANRMEYKPPWSILAPSTRGTWVVVSPTKQ
jgi:dTDP-4-amino-4,6-dideoxygalactose transaminase